MVKAYDVKELVAKYKARGLDIAEDAAIMILEETMDWVEESAKISTTPYDDIVAVVIPVAKKEAMKAIDKIDGKVG